MAGLTEEDIRRIVREELKSLLESLGATAHKLDDYDARELESSALMTIEKVVMREVDNFPHDWKCNTRIGNWINRTCNCDVGKEKNDG